MLSYLLALDMPNDVGGAVASGDDVVVRVAGVQPQRQLRHATRPKGL